MSAGQCQVCHKGEERLVTCARCGNRRYCGPVCQRADWSTHKSNCQPRIYPSWILKISLCPSEIRSPAITRTLVCPDTANFHQLHQAIQIAFNWSDLHSYDFIAKDPSARPLPEFNLLAHILRREKQDRGEHVDNGPRQNFVRFVNPRKPTNECRMMDTLHEPDRRHSQTPEKLANKVLLGEQFRRRDLQTAKWEYLYDFGDDWEHKIEIIGRGEVDDGFECVGGEGHWCAEDVGGSRGWERLKAAYRTANPDEDQRETMAWFEHYVSNGDPRGLRNGRENFWDRDGINLRLRELS